MSSSASEYAKQWEKARQIEQVSLPVLPSVEGHQVVAQALVQAREKSRELTLETAKRALISGSEDKARNFNSGQTLGFGALRHLSSQIHALREENQKMKVALAMNRKAAHELQRVAAMVASLVGFPLVQAIGPLEQADTVTQLCGPDQVLSSESVSELLNLLAMVLGDNRTKQFQAFFSVQSMVSDLSARPEDEELIRELVAPSNDTELEALGTLLDTVSSAVGALTL